MAQIITYSIYIFFGFLPSIIWLLFYLRKDSLPESNRMIIKIFIYGMFSAIGVVLAGEIIKLIFIPTFFLATVIVSPALEEIAKYLVVRLKVVRHFEFDEPVDAMIYMIVAALGLAAIENLLYLSPFLRGELPLNPAILSALRFVGATFLHVLCSALVGYYLALSFSDLKNKTKLIFQGLLTATLLHGFFNFLIIKSGKEGEAGFWMILVIILLISLSLFINFAFKRLKKLKSVSKIQNN